MLDIWHFAITSTRREDEICRLLWEDNDPKTRTGLVHDAKHPENKEGNHRRFRYTQEAWNTPNFGGVLHPPPTNDRNFLDHYFASVYSKLEADALLFNPSFLTT